MTDLFIFAGGGTGGHLFPGIAVAESLQREHPQARVLFIGSDREVERRILADHGLRHVALPLAPLCDLRRRPDRFFWRNGRALARARSIIRDERPRAVIGLGGMASAPTVWAAHSARVPIVLMEQNAIPGRATCWLASWARTICLAYSECLDHLPQHIPALICGNPLRRDIARLLHEPMRGSARKTILVLGGSQGAESLNAVVVEMVREHRAALHDWTIVHQTGPRQVESVQSFYAAIDQPHLVTDFFADMVEQYRRADIVISRAGATTLAELACAGKPMVLVPYPHAADDHQRTNAEAFARHGAATVVIQRPSPAETAAQMWSALGPWLKDEVLRCEIGQAARSLARADAAERIVSLLQDAVRSAA